MLIIATILITVIVAPCPAAEKSRSTTSTATRRGTDEATQATPAMIRAMNVPFPDIGAAAMAMNMVDTTKEQ
jgi:hypothetical protein